MGPGRRVLLSKILLLIVAFAAAWAATRTPADILFLVGAAFSFAASTFFPVLVLGIFWKGANKWGACCGMLTGLCVTVVYMIQAQPWLRHWILGISTSEPVTLWWDIQPIAAGVFAWMQTSNLTAETKLRTAAEAAKTQAEAALAAAGKDVAALKSAKDAAEAAAKSAKDEIAKIEGAKSAAEAAAKAARDEVAKVQAARDAADAAAKAAKDEVAKLEAAKATAEAAATAAKDEVAKLQSAKDAAEKALADVRKAAQPQ
jgi:hypothetical protein